QSAAGFGLDQNVESVGLRGGHREICFADQTVRESVREANPCLAVVDTFVNPSLARAAYNRPRLSLGAPHSGVHDVRMTRLKFEVDCTGGIRNEKHTLPGLAAVTRPEDTAF